MLQLSFILGFFQQTKRWNMVMKACHTVWHCGVPLSLAPSRVPSDLENSFRSVGLKKKTFFGSYYFGFTRLEISTCCVHP